MTGSVNLINDNLDSTFLKLVTIDYYIENRDLKSAGIFWKISINQILMIKKN